MFEVFTVGRTGADILVVDKALEGVEFPNGHRYLVSAHNDTVHISRLSGELREWTLETVDSHGQSLPLGYYGAAWLWGDEAFFANNRGKGIYGIKLDTVNLTEKSLRSFHPSSRKMASS